MYIKYNGGWIITLSLLLAFLLKALPLPFWAEPWRPAWVVMVLMYWCLALPHRVGIGIAWCIGLLLDVLQGTLLGQSALGLALVAYIVLNIHRRFRLFPSMQQSCLTGCIILLYLLAVSWVSGMIGISSASWTYWTPAVSSALLWPWLFIILRNVRQHYGIT